MRRRSHPPSARVLEQIRHELEVYALMFPRTSFSLQNLQDQRGARDSTWRIPKARRTTSQIISSFMFSIDRYHPGNFLPFVREGFGKGKDEINIVNTTLR